MANDEIPHIVVLTICLILPLSNILHSLLISSGNLSIPFAVPITIIFFGESRRIYSKVSSRHWSLTSLFAFLYSSFTLCVEKGTQLIYCQCLLSRAPKSRPIDFSPLPIDQLEKLSKNGLPPRKPFRVISCPLKYGFHPPLCLSSPPLLY